jgi:hypothetical protein
VDDAVVRGWFAELPMQRPVQDERSAVWFENGQVVDNDPNRRRNHFVTEERIDDPVLRLQVLLRERLQQQAAFTAAVSFARVGR